MTALRLCLPFAAALLLVSVTAATAQLFPRSGYDGAPNGQVAPFVGRWGMKFPEPEGTIVSAVIVGCETPIAIEAVDDTNIRYVSPNGPPSEFEVFEFEGRTTWYPAGAPTFIAVWLDPDRFHLHTTDMGRADWDNPRLMYRCPAD